MAILGKNLDLLKKRLPNDPKLLRFVDGAIQGAERGSNLTKRMLSFARRQDLKPEIINIADLVSGMTDMLGRSLGPAIEITTEFEADLPACRVDPNQLELAILNLSLNARDAMPLGGTLRITARREVVSDGDLPGLVAGRYVCLTVRDTGAGMEEATLREGHRAVLHNQRRREGDGGGSVHGGWPRCAVRRRNAADQPIGGGHCDRTVVAGIRGRRFRGLSVCCFLGAGKCGRLSNPRRRR